MSYVAYCMIISFADFKSHDGQGSRGEWWLCSMQILLHPQPMGSLIAHHTSLVGDPQIQVHSFLSSYIPKQLHH